MHNEMSTGEQEFCLPGQMVSLVTNPLTADQSLKTSVRALTIRSTFKQNT